MSDDRMLDKIRKILAKAEDPGCTPAEAEALTEKAAELMAKYGVERAMLAATEPTSDKIMAKRFDIENPYGLDKCGLLFRIAKPLRCNAVRFRRWDAKGARAYYMEVVGYESDIERVEMLFTSLLVQAAHALAVAEVPYWESATSYRKTWYDGFSGAVNSRLRKAEAAAVRDAEPTTGPSTALVIADRSSAVEQAYKQFFPDVRPGRARNLNGSGQGAGWRAGQNANLGAGRNVGSGASGKALGR